MKNTLKTNQEKQMTKITIKITLIESKYKKPFSFDGHGYIDDADGNMVADFYSKDGSIRPRGWGRFQYMEDGDKIHDAMEALILSTCAGLKSPEACVVALNALWDGIDG